MKVRNKVSLLFTLTTLLLIFNPPKATEAQKDTSPKKSDTVVIRSTAPELAINPEPHIKRLDSLKSKVDSLEKTNEKGLIALQQQQTIIKYQTERLIIKERAKRLKLSCKE